MIITVFTDGSSRGNPGPGGWAALVREEGEKNDDPKTLKVIELGGRDEHTTNNRMELTAVIEALRAIRDRKFEGDIEIHTDSAYVLQGITAWVYGWERSNWMTKEGEPVLNQDLWMPLLEIARALKLSHDIAWKKVPAHAGVLGNERVDTIATGFADKKFVLLFSGTRADYAKLLGSDMLHSVSGESAAKPKKKTAKKIVKAHSYVSYIDGVIHKDATWAACERRVKGKKGAKYKKSASAEDEALIIKNFTS